MTRYPAFDGSQACAGHDTDEFFADAAGNTGGKIADAKAVCRGCAFLAPCASYALAHAVSGVWGGTTARERVAVRRARGVVAEPISLDLGGLRQAFNHGTPAGYRQHLRLKERACDPCRIAENERGAKYKRRRRAS